VTHARLQASPFRKNNTTLAMAVPWTVKTALACLGPFIMPTSSCALLCIRLCIFLSLTHGARLRSTSGAGGHFAPAGGAKTDGLSSALRLRRQVSPEVDAFEAEEVRDPLLDAALSKIDGWVEETRQADETGTLGMPPPGSNIIIDGPSAAWGHGQHKRFSTDGLKAAIDFFLDKGYPSVVAFVSLTYSQEPPKGSPRTRVADDVDALKALREAGLVHFVPPGASEDGMLLQYAFSQQAFVVSNNDFADFKLECSQEEEEWVRTHHIYFSWHAGHLLPTCDRDHRAPRQPWISNRDLDGHDDDAAAQYAKTMAEEEELGHRVLEARPPFAWIPVGGMGVCCVF